MKTAMVFANGIKQVMLTPETDEERAALKLLTPDDDIAVERKWGTFFDTYPPSAAGYVVQESRGEYLRAYECRESLMLVIRPKKPEGA